LCSLFTVKSIVQLRHGWRAYQVALTQLTSTKKTVRKKIAYQTTERTEFKIRKIS
jgi:hypothetical protein